MLLNSRLIKIKEYASLSGFQESLKDFKYLLRRSFLGLPRLEILEALNVESESFEINIPNYTHGNIQNASLTINDKLAICLLCHLLKPKTVIEIGTFRGETTDLMARNLFDADIYTLDLPPDFTEHKYRPDDSDLNILELRQNNFYINQPYTTNSRICQLYGDSAEFAFDKLNITFDLAFIDGAHSYDYVKNDTEKLLPLMNTGAWIIWDDYSFNFPEVIKYVNTLGKQGAFHIYGTRLAALKI